MKIKWHNTIESTFSGMEIAKNQLADKEVWAARFQTAGRGQKGNTWCSANGENLTFSIYLRHRGLEARNQFAVCQAVSLGVCRYLVTKGVDASIKWPNDIYVGDRKICGILISNTVSGALLKDSVAGIGINLNQIGFPDWVPNPVSLKLITGNDYVIEDELPLALNEIFAEYDAIGDSTAPDYLRRLYLKDTPHIFTDAASREQFEGSINGVATDGRLSIIDKECTHRLFAFKEVIY